MLGAADPSLTRRDLFREAVRGLAWLWSAPETRVLPSYAWASRPAFVRPPEALPESEFLAACTRCGDCVRACEPLALRKAGPELGGLLGTPIIVPSENPCVNCEGLPCAAACATGALKR